MVFSFSFVYCHPSEEANFCTNDAHLWLGVLCKLEINVKSTVQGRV